MVEVETFTANAHAPQRPLPPTPAEDIELDKIKPFSELIKAREALPHQGIERRVYESAVGRIPTDSTQQLLIRLKTAEDAVVAWGIHRELTARGLPPVMRDRGPRCSRQHEFLNVAADVYWVVTKYPGHLTLFERARPVFRYAPGVEQWHKAVVFVYRMSAGQPHRVANALGLTDDMRRMLLVMGNRQQNYARRVLRERCDRIREELMSFAVAHPDKSGVTTAEDIVQRQIDVLWFYLHSGRSASVTAECMAAMTNSPMQRRMVTQHIARIEQRSATAERVLALPL
ncbi:hypothetical protein [Leptothrix discophora]|uniref:Uncharacterized protein n=1 Tax=Leptothrix discophora TaxID=89 RepID=A0ABT9G6D4_LEPDI|nr:hypothetical protein [Leptothrix discophora]MDP4301980.1 hypothetical protein [Leptothrix discophora]